MFRSTMPLFAFAFAASAPAFAADYIPVPAFRSVQLEAGGDVAVVPGPVQRVILVNGSTALTHFRVRDNGRLEISTNCQARCPRNYNLRIRIETPNLPDLAVRAGGAIDVAPGFAPQRSVSAAVLAGGTINMRAVQAQSASTAINAGGDIYVGPSSRLNVAINAGGNVHYAGNPQLSTAIANGGGIRRIR